MSFSASISLMLSVMSRPGSEQSGACKTQWRGRAGVRRAWLTIMTRGFGKLPAGSKTFSGSPADRFRSKNSGIGESRQRLLNGFADIPSSKSK
jgi:hypothetical protein